MRRILLTLLLLAYGAFIPLLARDTTRVDLLPSRFGDNWFIQVGGGVNTVFNKGFGPVGPAAELRVGKWVNPAFGIRVGAQGFLNRPNGTETGWFSGREAFWFGHADVDVMWNVLNSFRYSEKRFWDLVPYLRLGAVYNRQTSGEPAHLEPGGGLGLHNGLRLGKRVDLYLEASVIASREKAYRERGGMILFPSATAGLVVRVGRTGWQKRGERTRYVDRYVDREVVRTDTLTIEKEKVVVDSVLIKEIREHPLILYFDLDQTILTQRELDHLERYAIVALTRDTKVHLTGSADKETGNSEHNQWLSEMRNAYVKDILIRVYGLRKENISETANGDRKNEFRTMEQNRCVTITIIDEKEKEEVPHETHQ